MASSVCLLPVSRSTSGWSRCIAARDDARFRFSRMRLSFNREDTAGTVRACAYHRCNQRCMNSSGDITRRANPSCHDISSRGATRPAPIRTFHRLEDVQAAASPYSADTLRPVRTLGAIRVPLGLNSTLAVLPALQNSIEQPEHSRRLRAASQQPRRSSRRPQARSTALRTAVPRHRCIPPPPATRRATAPRSLRHSDPG